MVTTVPSVRGPALDDARLERLGYLFATVSSAIAVAVVVVSRAAVGDGQPGFAERDLPALAQFAGAAFMLIGAAASWAAAPRHPRAAVALASAQVAATVPLLASWHALPDRPASILLAVLPLTPAGLLLTHLTWRPSSQPGSALTVLVLTLSVTAALTHALGYNPFADLACARTCALVPAPLAPVLATQTAVILTAILMLLANVVAMAAVSRTVSLSHSLLLWGIVISLVGAAALNVVQLTTLSDTAATGRVVLLQALTPLPLAAAVISTVWQDRWRRRALDSLVRALAREEPLASRGPIRAVHFARDEGDGWFDVHGEPVEDADLGSTTLSGPSGPAVRLVLAAHASEADVLEALSPATRLALRNAQLIASLRRRMHEVQESQRRVVAVSDAERRRIERDLHDGAQQLLVGVAFHLRLARNEAVGAAVGRLAAAEEEVMGVLAHLRRLAHGAVPAALADEGLAAALTELVEETPYPARTKIDVPAPVAIDGALAAYVAIAAILAAPGTPSPRTAAVVQVISNAEELRVSVWLGGIDGPVDPESWVDAADRVGALGGLWRVVQEPSALTLQAVVPCV